MNTTIERIARALEFPEDAIFALLAGANRLSASSDAMTALADAKQKLYAVKDASYEEDLTRAAELSGVARYTVDMIFFLSCAPTMREYYDQKGVSEKIYMDSLLDLRYKLIECKDLHGYYGSFTKNWFPRFLRAEAFALGRLQYEYKPFPMDSYKNLLKKGDTVCNCHIPSSGALLKEDVLDSLKQAYAFFPEQRRNGILPITCNSWLLYPPVAALFKKGSNLESFYQIFEILSTKEQPQNSDFWRIFSIPFSPENLQNATEKSTLQRNVKAYLQAGNCLGNGLGLILFDGEKILTEHTPS